MDTIEKLTALRQQMAAVGADYYLIPSQDAHQSEYVAAYWRARAYFSHFTGSAGTLLVDKEEAFLWVDGRYHIQAEQQTAGSGITVFKMGLPGVPNMEDWMKEHMQAGERVAYDGRMISIQMGERESPFCVRRIWRVESGQIDRDCRRIRSSRLAPPIRGKAERRSWRGFASI